MSNYAESVYESLLGELVDPIPGVEDAFAEGAPCEVWYGEMQAAYGRLRDRLGVTGEDKDVEAVISALLKMQKELCLKMYQYGAKFGDRA